MSEAGADIDARLDRLMDAAVRLDEMTLMKVVDAWMSEEDAARRDAWRRVKRALKETGRERMMNETRDRVSRWVGDAQPGGGALYIPGVTWQQNDTARLRAEAAPAILDAAAVIIVGESLDQEDRTLLAGPFGARLSKAGTSGSRAES